MARHLRLAIWFVSDFPYAFDDRLALNPAMYVEVRPETTSPKGGNLG